MADTTAPLLIGRGGAFTGEAVEVEFDTVSVGVTESSRTFVQIATGDTLRLRLSDLGAVTSSAPPAADIVLKVSADTLTLGLVEPEDVTYDIQTSSDSLTLGTAESGVVVEVTGGVRSDVVRMTQFSPAGIPGKKYRVYATRTVGILTRFSPAGMPGKAI